MDTKVLDWGQPLEAVYSDGEVKPVNCKDITKRSKDQWWVQTGPNVYLVDADTGRTADGFPTIRNVAPKRVEWGPEIKVEGKRPDGIADTDMVWVHWADENCWSDLIGPKYTAAYFEGDWRRLVDKVCLPANHPHYATPTRTALEQRMEALCRKLAKHWETADPSNIQDDIDEAARIVAELPEPVDGDLLEARKLVYAEVYHETLPQLLTGAHDNSGYVNVALAAIKRGRALERGE